MKYGLKNGMYSLKTSDKITWWLRTPSKRSSLLYDTKGTVEEREYIILSSYDTIHSH